MSNQHSPDEDRQEPHIVHIYNYVFVGLALAVLTGVTAWVAFFDFGRMNTFIAIAIAVFKTFLVCAIFMHLKWSPKLLWLIAGAGGIFFIIMITFTLADFDAQGKKPIPKTWVVHGENYPDSTAAYLHEKDSPEPATPEHSAPHGAAPAQETK